MLEAALFLQLQLLANKCELHMADHITIQNAIHLLEFATLHTLPVLAATCAQVISSDFSVIQKSGELGQLSSGGWVGLLQSTSEFDLSYADAVVQAVIDWVMEEEQARKPQLKDIYCMCVIFIVCVYVCIVCVRVMVMCVCV